MGWAAYGTQPDRPGKAATKRHVIVDGQGVPLAINTTASSDHARASLQRLAAPATRASGESVASVAVMVAVGRGALEEQFVQLDGNKTRFWAK